MSVDRLVPVLVTTQHKGVFFGFAANDDLENKSLIRLDRVKCCMYWHESVGGFLGLASAGPNDQCRIGKQAEHVVLHDITALVICSEEAVSQWSKY